MVQILSTAWPNLAVVRAPYWPEALVCSFNPRVKGEAEKSTRLLL